MIDDKLFVILRYRNGIDRIDAVRGFDLAVTDRDGNGLLHEAAVVGDSHFASHLIASGVDVDFRNTHNQTAAHLAVVNRQIEVLRILLQHGCDVNASDADGMTPLLTAVATGDRGPAISLLLESGGNPSWKGPHGFSAVELAEKREDLEVVRLLRRN